MKVLHLVESLVRGGLERVVLNLALAQKAAGHDVAICCLFTHGQLFEEAQQAGITVSCAAKRSGMDLRAVMRVRSELRRTGAEVLHTHNAVANYYGTVAALGIPVRVVNTRHGMGFVGTPGLKERLFRLSLHYTDVVALVCNAARCHYIDHGIVPAALARIVPNGIEIERFRADETSRRAARALLGLSEAEFVVGSVGRLNWAKNHRLLIEAIALMVRERPATRLVLIGDGELRGDLIDHIQRLNLQRHVVLLGDRSDVPALLPALDVFALSSVTEGYSMALLEAAAAGLCTVATDVGGNAEIVCDGTTGRVLENATAESFATALLQLAMNDGERRAMGVHARSWVERHGSVAAMARAYGELYAAANAPGVLPSRALT